jgi:hypothetical protein
VTRAGLLAVLVAVLAAGTAEAVSFTLDARRLQEATAFGERTVAQDDFGDEWRVRNPAGEQALVMTPFHRVALAARQAAFRKSTLKPREAERIAKQYDDRLVLWVDVKGARADFARFYSARLLAGDRQVEAAFVQNERTPVRGDDGKFLARCVYAFPIKALTPTGKVVLVVRDADSRQVTSFNIDLASMR